MQRSTVGRASARQSAKAAGLKPGLHHHNLSALNPLLKPTKLVVQTSWIILMRQVGSFEAKTHLAELLAAAEAGETITITRRGKPVARLVPAGGNLISRQGLREEVAQLRRDISASGGGMTMEEIIAAKNEGRR